MAITKVKDQAMAIQSSSHTTQQKSVEDMHSCINSKFNSKLPTSLMSQKDALCAFLVAGKIYNSAA